MIAVDLDVDMVRVATISTADLPQVEVRRGARPFRWLPRVDRIRVDRALQQVDRALQQMASPIDVLTELRRLCRSGGVAVLHPPA